MTTHDHNPKHPPVLFETVASSLIWPALLRCPSMAFQHSRWALGILCVLALKGVVLGADMLHTKGFSSELFDALAGGFRESFSAAVSLDFAAIDDRLREDLAAPVWSLVRDDPVGFVIVGLLMLLVWSFFSAAIARITAVQIATDSTLSALAGARYAVRSVRAVFAAHLLPLGIAAIAGLAAWGAACALPAFPALALVPALVLVCVLALYGACSLLLAPSVACERSDSVDAIQRCAAYTLARPIRILVYASVAAAVGILAHAVLSFIVGGAVSITHALTSAADPIDQTAMWVQFTGVLIDGYVLSLVMSSSTVIYLLIRRVCDEQDVRDIVLDDRFVSTSAVTSTVISKPITNDG